MSEVEFDNLQKVEEIVNSTFGLRMVLTPSTPLSSIPDFDSLDKTELMMKVEKEFDITIMDHEISDWTTINDILLTIESKTNG